MFFFSLCPNLSKQPDGQIAPNGSQCYISIFMVLLNSEVFEETTFATFAFDILQLFFSVTACYMANLKCTYLTLNKTLKRQPLAREKKPAAAFYSWQLFLQKWKTQI